MVDLDTLRMAGSWLADDEEAVGEGTQWGQAVLDAAAELEERRRAPADAPQPSAEERLERCRDRAAMLMAYRGTVHNDGGRREAAENLEKLARELLAAERPADTAWAREPLSREDRDALNDWASDLETSEHIANAALLRRAAKAGAR